MSVDATARPARPARRRFGTATRGVVAGFAAVGAKELRGRMRGRRAFVIVTIYLLLLSLFAWAIYQYKLVGGDPFTFSGSFPDIPTPGSTLAAATRSAEVGHALFAGLLVLLTILVLVLAPALTSGTISQEREKQTLEMLVATPLSTTGMVLSKLLSALVYLFLLILASIPVASIVFTFGGVGPEDVLRAYVVLFAVAFGVGAVGLFFSAIARRTQVATVLSYVTVLAVTLGGYVLWVFWGGIASSGPTAFEDGRFVRRLPPQQVLWLNPLVADLDVLCGAGLTRACEFVAQATNRPWFGSFSGGAGNGGVGLLDLVPGSAASTGELPVAGEPDCVGARCAAGMPIAAVDPGTDVFSTPRDLIWPQIAATFVGLGLLLTAISSQLVAPTRRLGFRGRPGRRRAAPISATIVPDTGTTDAVAASGGERAVPANATDTTAGAPVLRPPAAPGTPTPPREETAP